MDKILIGIDIGGTKISVCVGDSKGHVYASKRFPTKIVANWQEGTEKIIKNIEELLEKFSLEKKNVQCIGISAPGPLCVKEGKLIAPPNLHGWKDAYIVASLKKAFCCQMIFNNDANAQVLAEFFFGAFQGTKNLVYLTCSTGMGGGIISDGKLVQGISDTAGEIGHIVLDIHGPDCPCSQKGCFEIYCGGANFRKKVQDTLRNSSITTQVLEEVEGNIDAIDLIHLEKALHKKDAFAENMWDEFTTRLAQGIGVILMTFNPQVVILGTIAIHMQAWMLPKIQEKLPQFCWKMPRENCTIATSALGTNVSELAGLALACSFFQGK